MNEPKRYRKRPVEVEAMQFTGDNGPVIARWADSSGGEVDPGDRTELRIHTLEGTMSASKGDYVIRGVQGEFYPIKEAIFRETYEEAEDS